MTAKKVNTNAKRSITVAEDNARPLNQFAQQFDQPASDDNTANVDDAVSMNPFVHAWRGTKAVISTNIVPLLGISALVAVVQIASIVAISFAILGLMLRILPPAHAHPSGFIGTFSIIAAAIVALMLVQGFFSLAYGRAVLAGSRLQKVSLAGCFPVPPSTATFCLY